MDDRALDVLHLLAHFLEVDVARFALELGRDRRADEVVVELAVE